MRSDWVACKDVWWSGAPQLPRTACLLCVWWWLVGIRDGECVWCRFASQLSLHVLGATFEAVRPFFELRTSCWNIVELASS